MSDNVNNEKVHGLPLNISGFAFFILFLFLIFIFSFGSLFHIIVSSVINYAFIVYFFCFTFTLENQFCFSKITKILFIFFFLRILTLINCSILISKNTEITVIKLFFDNQISFFFLVCILLSISAIMLYFLKTFLENVSFIKKNENQILFKNSIINIISLLKIEFIIIIIVFIFNIANIYVCEIINNNTLAVYQAIGLSSEITILAIIPVLMLIISLIFITFSYYNNDYFNDYKSNLSFMFSSNTSSIITILFLVILIIILKDYMFFIIPLIFLFIFCIHFNFVNKKTK